MKNRYMVTAIGGDIGSSVVHCLSQEFFKECIVGCDITPDASGYDEVGSFFGVPPYRSEKKYIEVMLQKCHEQGITHILPVTEGEIRVFDRHRDSFYTAGIKVMIHPSKLLDTAFSKYDTARAVREMGLYSPETWKPCEVPKRINYPVIVKSDHGCGSKHVRIAYSLQEYENAVMQIEDAVIQKYIGSSQEEYTVEVFSSGTDIRSIAFRRTLLSGMSGRVELIEDQRIHQIAATVADAFQLRGSLNIQMRYQNDKYFILGINPRLSSTVIFRYMLGFKDVIWWIGLLDGKKEMIPYEAEKQPIVGFRTFGSKIFRGGVLLLTGNHNALSLYNWLSEQCTVHVYSKKMDLAFIRELGVELIISYNYNYIIGREIIDYMKGKIINLHISYLPWNRGSSPNIWSFIENTPKGVTIHQIDEGLDTGKILFQKECWFEPEKETFASTYRQLNETVFELFKENWNRIRNGEYELHEQKGQGSYHTMKDLQKLKQSIEFEWSDNIAKFLRKYEALGKR